MYETLWFPNQKKRDGPRTATHDHLRYSQKIYWVEKYPRVTYYHIFFCGEYISILKNSALKVWFSLSISSIISDKYLPQLESHWVFLHFITFTCSNFDWKCYSCLAVAVSTPLESSPTANAKCFTKQRHLAAVTARYLQFIKPF